jgi:low temperature requirement protein LtrA
VWWAWEQFAWTLNAANADHVGIRLGTLVSTAAAFFMAVMLPDAFTADGWWFAVAYIIVKLVAFWLYGWVAVGDLQLQVAVKRFSLVSLAGLTAVAVGAALPAGPRTVALAAAVAADIFSTWLARNDEWRLFPGHFAERHALFVIIALGESLIAAGVASGEGERTLASATAATAAVIAACALWWTYFGSARKRLEQAFEQRVSAARGQFARDVYTLGHFPIVAGVIGFAVAIEEAVAHPVDRLEPPIVTALIVGVVLFVGGVALALIRAHRRIPVERAVMVVALVAAAPLLGRVSATAALALAAALITAVAVIEGVRSSG